MQIYSVCVCIYTSRARSRSMRGFIRRISGPDKVRLSGHFSVRSVDRVPKFDAFYGPLFRESMRIRTRERRDNAGIHSNSQLHARTNAISMGFVIALIKIKCPFSKFYKSTITNPLISFPEIGDMKCKRETEWIFQYVGLTFCTRDDKSVTLSRRFVSVLDFGSLDGGGG